MPTIQFLRKKAFHGVTYTIFPENTWNSRWKLKHQVPILQELPIKYVSYNLLRFPRSLKYLPNDSGESYSHFYIKPIKLGDVLSRGWDDIGVIGEINVKGSNSEGFYIEIVYSQTFEKINNQQVLVNASKTEKIGMGSLLWIFQTATIKKLEDVKYIEAASIIPYYSSIISEKDREIRELKNLINKYESTLGSLNEHIEKETYKHIQTYTPKHEDTFKNLPFVRSRMELDEKIASAHHDQQQRRYAREDRRRWENEADELLRKLQK